MLMNLVAIIETVSAKLERQWLTKAGQSELSERWQVDVARYVSDIWRERYPEDAGELRKTDRVGWPIAQERKAVLSIVRMGKAATG